MILYSNMLVCVVQPCGDAVSLLENVALISEGTTGLVTWEAALYLAEWALNHQQLFTGRYSIFNATTRTSVMREKEIIKKIIILSNSKKASDTPQFKLVFYTTVSLTLM